MSTFNMYSINHIHQICESQEAKDIVLQRLKGEADRLHDINMEALEQQHQASSRLTNLADKRLIAEYNYYAIKSGLSESRSRLAGINCWIYNELLRHSDAPSDAQWQHIMAYPLKTLVEFGVASGILELSCWIETSYRYKNHDESRRPMHLYACQLIHKIKASLESEAGISPFHSNKQLLLTRLERILHFCQKWQNCSSVSSSNVKRSYCEGTIDHLTFLEIMESLSQIVRITEESFDAIAGHQIGRLGDLDPRFYIA